MADPTSFTTAAPTSRTTAIAIGPSSAMTVADASNGNAFANDGATYLYVYNDAGTSSTFVLYIPFTVEGQAVTDITLTVTTKATNRYGPFPPGIYNQTNGTVKVKGSSTDVFFKAIRA